MTDQSDTTARVGVLGATGFIGTQVTDALHARSHSARSIQAPRVTAPLTPAMRQEIVDALTSQLQGLDAVINCAGISDATTPMGTALEGANGLLPGLVGEACVRAGVGRYVHMSSASVQGNRTELDSDPATNPISDYAQTKARGEHEADAHGPAETVIYRPPSVQGAGRPVTQALIRLSRSPLASVSGKGDQPTPQVLVENVADAAAFLAVTPLPPPRIVHHPAEGMTTAALLRQLGGREPRHLPTALTRALLAVARRLPSAWMRAQTRRVELMWLGQGSATSWLEQTAWRPVCGQEAWARLAAEAQLNGASD